MSKRHGGGEVLTPLDLAVGANELLTIPGPSGSAETTILRLVVSGTVTIDLSWRVRRRGELAQGN